MDKIKKIEVFQTEDGKKHRSEIEAKQHLAFVSLYEGLVEFGGDDFAQTFVNFVGNYADKVSLYIKANDDYAKENQELYGFKL